MLLEGNQAAPKSNGVAFMDKCQNVTGQYWKFEDAGNGYYRLKTMFRGNAECLEGNQAGSQVHNGLPSWTSAKTSPANSGRLNLLAILLPPQDPIPWRWRILEGNQAAPVHGGNAFMDSNQNVSGQLWKFVPVDAKTGRELPATN
ncbi:MAG: hypothetical protein U0176_09180 [Bacteroidia bacterium]